MSTETIPRDETIPMDETKSPKDDNSSAKNQNTSASDEKPSAKDEKNKAKKKSILEQAKERYEKMTPAELQKSMAVKLMNVAKQEEKMQLITKSIKNSTETLEHYQKVLMGLLISAIVVFILFIVYKVAMVYIQYRDFISWVNSQPLSSTDWPTGGMGTAMSLQYPIMAGWFGFTDVYLPLAAYVSWQQYGTFVLLTTGKSVNDSSAYVLSQMYCFAALGGALQSANCTTTDDNDIPAWETICCGWGNENNLGSCMGEYCDTSLSSKDYWSAASGAIGAGTQGAMAGGMHGGGATGSGVGFIAMAGITAAISLWQAKQQKQANADSNGCAD